ncbi:MAG: 2-C-methyl-D-erythritol 4-phosphate cytidylyltransferase, partial [Bacteroidota bacterium]|nr:2-C-methyl-D-erythritol 4-phosphate cytidylyltransferase [Bacteroidota bacterium]
MKHSAIIVAGGSGSRMRASMPKQFMLLKGEPVLFHNIRAFHSFDPTIRLIIVLPEAHHGTWADLCEQRSLFVPHEVVSGGAERFHSVKAGVDLLDDEGLVAVHDGVRPLISVDLITRCFNAAGDFGSAVPVVPINSSVR